MRSEKHQLGPIPSASYRCGPAHLHTINSLSTTLESERRRHVAHYETSPSIPLRQETRGLNELTGETYALRLKEEAEDYRYMPDANLPVMVIDAVSAPALINPLTAQGYLDALRRTIPEMLWDTVDRLTGLYGVARRDVETLIGLDEYDAKGVKYYEDVTRGNVELGKKALNW